MREPLACAFRVKLEIWLLLDWSALGGGVAGEDRVVGVGAGEHDGEADGGEHEEDGGPGGELGEEVGGAAGAEGGLGALTTECSGEIGRFALLEKDDSDEEEGDDDVEDNYEIDHQG